MRLTESDLIRWGRTIGKALLAIEVVPAHAGGPPGLRRAAIRFLAQWGPPYVAWGVSTLSDADMTGGVGRWVAFVLGLAVIIDRLRAFRLAEVTLREEQLGLGIEAENRQFPRQSRQGRAEVQDGEPLPEMIEQVTAV